jgi:signal transduction histidine kinase/AmiR/NasT family two-component response regulator
MTDPNQKSKKHFLVRVYRDLPIARRLSLITVIFAFFLIALAVATIVALELLSSSRAYVGGEGLYSKAQKDAIYYLVRYADSHSEEEYESFLRAIKVPLADRKARLELEKADADFGIIAQALIDGRNHPEDVRAMIRVFKLRNIGSNIDKAIGIWAEADDYIIKIKELGDKLHVAVSEGRATAEKTRFILDELDAANRKLMSLEDGFSMAFGEAARQIKKNLMYFMLLIFTLSLTAGALMTFLISANIRKKIVLLKEGAARVAQSNYGEKIGLESENEFGRLAAAFNIMSQRCLEARKGLEQKNKELLSANEEVKKACDSALAATRLKSAFLANMSHEIRTPMTAVIGFADMLLDTDLDENQIDYVKTITASGESLLSLIDDILDFSKIEAGLLVFEQIDFDPKPIAYDVCNMLRPRIEPKPIELLCHIGDNLPSLVRGDPKRLRQVLLNLLDNAAKFTESGEIELGLDMEKEGAGGKSVKLHATVRDTGIGIPKDKLHIIFDSFRQADTSTTRKFGGTGLGLAICKQIVNLGHGDIRAESEVGKGSTFHATAWFGKVERPAGETGGGDDEDKATKREKMKRSVRILLAEDTPVNQMLIRTMLTNAGYQTEMAGHGREAFEKYAASPESFDLILMDIEMPEMNGIEAACAIRKFEAQSRTVDKLTGKAMPEKRHIPIIAISAHAMQDDREKALEAGIDGYISKPINTEILFNAIKKLAF